MTTSPYHDDPPHKPTSEPEDHHDAEEISLLLPSYTETDPNSPYPVSESESGSAYETEGYSSGEEEEEEHQQQQHQQPQPPCYEPTHDYLAHRMMHQHQHQMHHQQQQFSNSNSISMQQYIRAAMQPMMHSHPHAMMDEQPFIIIIDPPSPTDDDDGGCAVHGHNHGGGNNGFGQGGETPPPPYSEAVYMPRGDDLQMQVHNHGFEWDDDEFDGDEEDLNSGSKAEDACKWAVCSLMLVIVSVVSVGTAFHWGQES